MKLNLLTLSTLVSMAQAHELDFVREIRVPANPEAVWKALTDPEIVKRYHLAPLEKIELKKDGEIIYGDGKDVLISGTITECETNAKLAHTFRFGAKGHPRADQDPDTLVIYEIRTDGDGSILKMTHTGFTEKNQTHANISGGWPFILKQLEDLLKTP